MGEGRRARAGDGLLHNIPWVPLLLNLSLLTEVLIRRFVVSTDTTELTVRPDAFDPHLDVDFDAEEAEPAAA